MLTLARAPIELAEAEVAMGDEGAHATGLSKGPAPLASGLATPGITPIGMGSGVADKIQAGAWDPG